MRSMRRASSSRLASPSMAAVLLPTARVITISTARLPHHVSFSTSSTQHHPGGQFSRSDFDSHGYTNSYETGLPTRGPLGEIPSGSLGQDRMNARITPKKMKEYLDRYVVGQEAAKKRLCVAVYNHWQRIREARRKEEREERERIRILNLERKERDMDRDRERSRGERWKGINAGSIGGNEEMGQGGEMGRYARNTHPTEDEYPGQMSTTDRMSSREQRDDSFNRRELGIAARIIEEDKGAVIEKSNIMVLGPTGVGKTLMIKLLARFLEVPFSMSDCTPLTQAGYVGDDAEICVQRLFAESGNNVSATENGIIYLDEVDKIAMAKTIAGKDVSGEGVQQALLKLIEGTTVHITPKSERTTQRYSSLSNYSASSQLSSSSSSSSASASSQKGESHAVRTDNILFIFSGAFVGLQKIILDRLSRGSIGFGANIRSSTSNNNPLSLPSSEAALFRKRPLLIRAPDTLDPNVSSQQDPITYNPLDLATPADFQKFGLIPEFIGRIPITTALSALSLSQLVRILTEPHNSLIAQFTALFAQESIELVFSSAAKEEIAKQAMEMGTGARGLRSVVEDLLAEAMYDAFGGSVRFVLVTGRAARWEEGCGFWGRGMGGRFRDACGREEEEFERRKMEEGGASGGLGSMGSFEEYREKATSGM